MLFYPLTGIFTLSFLVGIFLAIEGAIEIGMALVLRPFRHWKWMLVSGIAALILSVFIFMFFPAAGVMFLAFAVAFNMAAYGASLLMLAWRTGKAHRNYAKEV